MSGRDECVHGSLRRACEPCALTEEVQTARARVAELERVQDAAFRDAHRAEADAARLREALTQVRDAMLATGQEPDGDDDPRRPVATAVWRALASAPSAETWRQVGQHAAHPELDATPSAEPTPRAKAEAFFAGFAGDDDAGVLAWSEPSAEPTPRERVLVMSDAWKAAMDNVARLRFALEWCEANWTTPAVDRGAGLPMVRAALASTPRAEPTPRDMRVAEAVAREYERKLDLTGAGGLDIDLAAVVAKAVGT